MTAEEAVAEAGEGESVVGWKLDEEQRRELLQQFPPHYPHVVADHVTLKAKVSQEAPPPDAVTGEIVGLADDGRGVEALVISIGGTTDRPGGGTYHLTWSLDTGPEAQESNDVIARSGWSGLDLPMPVQLHPARFD